MPSIDISRAHDKPLAEARKSVERLAKQIAKRFDVEYAWEGDVLIFERSGVSGEISVSKGKVRVKAQLGFLLMAIQPAVEREIHKQLEDEFG